MNRRTLIRSIVGLAALLGVAPRLVCKSAGETLESDHECGAFCFDSAERIARLNIEETGEWKLALHDWSKRRMVVTRCGSAACEVRLASPGHHPYWEYTRRSLSPEEKGSFQAEFGRSHWLLLLDFRGFILNGRFNGWKPSVGPRV